MTENEFFEQFENATLDVNLFDHAAHVKMGWIYLKKYELPEALRKFSTDLKKFAAANNAAGLYHETITFAYLILINERLQNSKELNWQEFVVKFPELFDRKENILKKFYFEETLKSVKAKKYFIFPDKF